ncbi:MAG: hypothetical protein DWQ58_24175 [Microcystis aeruginosa TA09]|nr:MAG: hypothetical protein DWQ58_24175 [Microcystis aeruginosa TA09]
MLGSGKWEVGRINKTNLLTPISCLLSNAQKTGFSEKPVFYSCTHAKRGINNQSLITRFSMTPIS